MVEQKDLDPSMGVAVFSDGSAYAKDRTGGWAWVALDADQGLLYGSGNRSDTTISQMELFAPYRALSFLYLTYGACEVLVYSDSEYVVKGFMEKSRKRRKNLDFWQGLEYVAEKHTLVEFQHVKGHAGQKWNELADELAGEARKSIK